MVQIGNTEMAELAIYLTFIVTLALASYKINSIPLRVTSLIACFLLMPDIYTHGYIFSLVAFLLGLWIVAITMIDAFDKGPRV